MSGPSRDLSAERWKVFEESEEWKAILARVSIELDREINTVRANARVTGKQCETAYACGGADKLELVTRLPKIIRQEVAKGDKNA